MSKATDLERMGWRSTSNPDGKIEPDLGLYNNQQAAREGIQSIKEQIGEDAKNSEFKIVKTRDKDFPYDVLIRDRKNIQKNRNEVERL